MSTTDDKLEMLIGKFLDGEISRPEQRWLDDELQRNEQARELLEQLQVVSECGRQAIASGIVEQGGSPEEMLERTWRRHQRSPWRRVVKADGHLRFAAGLAVGFLLGVILHLALTWDDSGVTRSTARPVAERDVSIGGHLDRQAESFPVSSPSPSVMRNVDWYTFTDQTGHQWLVEGVREGMVRPAAYHGDL